MGISMIFFFLSCILILSPALMNLMKHWRDDPDHYNHAFHFKEPDLEAPRTFGVPCFDQPSFKVADKLCSILRRHGCSFCERWLHTDKAVFFYCDMRFCSDECRTERMKIDDAKERMENVKNSTWSPTQYSNAKGPLYLV